ncbi:MAG: DbpA RNA binding domain-containing protein, partial [Clostridiales bacterium]
GRTGRAGKSGNAITLCSGRKQVSILRNIGHVVKSDIKMMDIPSMEDIRQKNNLKNMAIVEDALADKISPSYKQIVDKLIEQGHAPEDIAAACLNLHFSLNDSQLNDIKIAKKEVKHSSKFSSKDFRQVQIDIGRNQRIAPNHIVGAMTQITELSGKDIGKIDIFDDTTIVSIPAESVKQVLEDMTGCKIGGHNTKTTLLSDKKLPISKKRVDKSGKPMDKTVKAKDKFFEKYAVEKRKKPSRRKYSHKEQ